MSGSTPTSVPLIGAPLAWQCRRTCRPGREDRHPRHRHRLHARELRRPGYRCCYQAAKATDTAPADPALFGPAAPKVKGGTDLVGDAYNGSNDPVPDPNPLDCESTSGSVGHGSHVAGTAPGFGVKADGTTFAGPYGAAATRRVPSASARASRRRRTSTRFESSAAAARPTSSPRPSTGRSPTA